MPSYNQVHWLVRTPYLSIKASDAILLVLMLKRALCIFTARKRSLGQANIITGLYLSVGGSLYDVTLCPMFLGGSLSGGSLSRGSLSRGVFVQRFSVQREVSVQGVYVHGVSLWGVSAWGFSVKKNTRTENPSGQYGEEWALRILLECFFVYDDVTLELTYMRLVGDMRFVHRSDQLHGVLWMHFVWETKKVSKIFREGKKTAIFLANVVYVKLT